MAKTKTQHNELEVEDRVHRTIELVIDAAGRDDSQGPPGPTNPHMNIYKLGPWCGRSGRTKAGMFVMGFGRGPVAVTPLSLLLSSLAPSLPGMAQPPYNPPCQRPGIPERGWVPGYPPGGFQLGGCRVRGWRNHEPDRISAQGWFPLPRYCTWQSPLCFPSLVPP